MSESKKACSAADFADAIARLQTGWEMKIRDMKRPGVNSVGCEVWVLGQATGEQVETAEALGAA